MWSSHDSWSSSLIQTASFTIFSCLFDTSGKGKKFIRRCTWKRYWRSASESGKRSPRTKREVSRLLLSQPTALKKIQGSPKIEKRSQKNRSSEAKRCQVIFISLARRTKGDVQLISRRMLDLLQKLSASCWLHIREFRALINSYVAKRLRSHQAAFCQVI